MDDAVCKLRAMRERADDFFAANPHCWHYGEPGIVIGSNGDVRYTPRSMPGEQLIAATDDEKDAA